MTKKIGIILFFVAVLVVLLAWLFIESTKPSPGEKELQDGRDHLPEGTVIDYKFNPPTSGNHYASWITKGFYDEPRADGNLVHSLEHGYIVLWYDCEGKATGNRLQLVGTAYADEGLSMTQGSEGSASAKLSDMPKAFSDGSCDNFKKDIKDIINKFGPHKLIAVPRVGMSSKLILTAWGRTEKLNSVDSQKIKQFIDAYRDQGPEMTNEP